MSDSRRAHRKTVKHYHEPGDFHELSCSCYRRMPLLTNDAWRDHLARSIDAAVAALQFRLVAVVFMPEHIHLLVFPIRSDATAQCISVFLTGIKMPCSQQVKEDLLATDSRLLAKLTVRERPGKPVFRFWQEGPGYDRNLQTQSAVLASMDYIHLNPVRRGLCKRIGDWRWSSARWYLNDGADSDPALPTIHGPPAEFFTG